MMKGRVIKQILMDDLNQGLRQLSDLLNPLLFFVIVIFLFPLTTDASATALQTTAPGAIWIAALLAVSLSLDKLFYYDYVHGTLEQLLLSPYPLPLLVLTKIFAHWLLTGFPLLLIAPMMGVLLDLSPHTIKMVFLSEKCNPSYQFGFVYQMRSATEGTHKERTARRPNCDVCSVSDRVRSWVALSQFFIAVINHAFTDTGINIRRQLFGGLSGEFTG